MTKRRFYRILTFAAAFAVFSSTAFPAASFAAGTAEIESPAPGPAAANPADRDERNETSDGSEMAPLLKAAAQGKFDIVKKLAGSGADVNAKTSTGDTALHYMALYGYGDIIEFLISKGADPEVLNYEKHTPLFLAALRNRREAIAVLEKHAKVKADELLKKEVFSEAARGRYMSVAAILKFHPDYLNLRDGEGSTLLHRAASAGRLAITKFLISKGLAVDAVDNQGMTPIFFAILEGRRLVFDYLLEKGASATHRTKSNTTPLHTAAAIDNYAQSSYYMSYALIMKGADVNAKMENDITPAWLAAGSGNTETIRLLSQKGAYLTDKTSDGSMPATIARERGNLDLAKLLTDLDLAWFNAPASGEICVAAANGDLERVKKIISSVPGALRETDSQTGGTALHVAAARGKTEVVKLLVEKGADIFAEDLHGRTALDAIADSAPAAGQKESAAFLVAKGLSTGSGGKKFNERLFTGNYLDDILYSSIFNYQNEMTAAALKAGAKAGARDLDGASPLHFTVMAANREAAEKLIESGANVDAADNHGRTPLHLAAEFGEEEFVSFFLSKGANTSLKEAAGKTALDLALENGFSDIADAIAKYKK